MLQSILISIHAPRVGSDFRHSKRSHSSRAISIHAPRVGSDWTMRWRLSSRVEFQSTLPVWGATWTDVETPMSPGNFNPRSPCGERRLRCRTERTGYPISIHAPRVGSDRAAPATPRASALFQSTLPVWGATWSRLHSPHTPYISIHAPRVGSDFRWMATGPPRSISIHAPRVGSDRMPERVPRLLPGFQSTLPVWGATVAGGDHPDGHGISIHAPRVGSDGRRRPRPPRRRNFNPRSPCGERHCKPGRRFRRERFQSTLPVWGATADIYK